MSVVQPSQDCHRIFLLGAGFSIAAGLPRTNELTDLVIERSVRHGKPEVVKDWIDFIRGDLCADNDPTGKINAEDFLEAAHCVETIWRSFDLPEATASHESRAADCERCRERFERNVPQVIWDRNPRGIALPDYVVKFTRQFDARTSVVSLNYDLLVEQGLRLAGLGFRHGFEQGTSASVPLVLKLHGSVDWVLKNLDEPGWDPSKVGSPTLLYSSRALGKELWRLSSEDAIDFVYRRSMKVNRERTSAVAPLGYRKPIDRLPGLGLVWHRAHMLLQHADEIYVVGCSMSDADRMAQVFFANAIRARKSPPRVFVLNPDSHCDEVTQRCTRVFRTQAIGIPCLAEDVDWTSLRPWVENARKLPASTT